MTGSENEQGQEPRDVEKRLKPSIIRDVLILLVIAVPITAAVHYINLLTPVGRVRVGVACILSSIAVEMFRRWKITAGLSRLSSRCSPWLFVCLFTIGVLSLLAF